jgi:hypothetical protein
MSSTTKTMTVAEKAQRIADLAGTADKLVGSDEGTHAGPITYRTYESVTGQRYTLKQQGGTTIATVSEEQAEERTEGRYRNFPNATAEIRAKARELAELKKSK